MTHQLEEWDFLSQGADEQTRQEAKNILSSYSQVYDILAESLQNAVDAVDSRYEQDTISAVAKIAILFDASKRSITVTDTGIGMPWEILRSAPSPNTTNKRRDVPTHTRSKPSRGEKGVGLSFLTFACNKLRVKTCDGIRTIEIAIDGSNDWVHGITDTRPMIKPITSDPHPVSWSGRMWKGRS